MLKKEVLIADLEQRDGLKMQVVNKVTYIGEANTLNIGLQYFCFHEVTHITQVGLGNSELPFQASSRLNAGGRDVNTALKIKFAVYIDLA